MYEALLDDGFYVSYSSVVNAVNSVERKKREPYIRQEYISRDVVEFDFELVNIRMSDGFIKEFQMAVFQQSIVIIDRLDCFQSRILTVS